MNMYVQCQCGQRHYTGSVETVNIEEDIWGRDVLTYVCPNSMKEMKALVLIDRDTGNDMYWND